MLYNPNESTIEGDMELKRQNTMHVIQEAIKRHKACTLMVYEEVPYLLKPFFDVGVRMFEVHAGSIYLGKDQLTKPGSPLQLRIENMHIARSILGDEAYITMPGYGTFTSTTPLPFTDEEALALSQAGASGCHTHKWRWNDLENLVKIAHRNGLVVDAYISHSKDEYFYYGIPADTPQEVSQVAGKMEKIGVDMIGILTGMTYQGLQAGGMSPELRKRIDALVNTTKVPTIIEGGITLENFKPFKETGAQILVVYTAFKDMIIESMKNAAKQILEG